MFTGLVQALGQVTEFEAAGDHARLRIKAPAIASELALGDSVSVNGVCLTALDISKKSFSADIMIQTLKLTNLGELGTGSPVNLELAMRASDRLGGHMVQGHVDGVGQVTLFEPGNQWLQLRIQIPADLLKFVQNQGSITINGVSLTVGSVSDQSGEVTVWLIPETLAKTNLSKLKLGASVNIEVDVMAKYVARIMEAGGTQ
jgi:riboflavin synthase